MERIFLPLNKTNKILKNIWILNQCIPGLVIETTTNSLDLSLQPGQTETIQVVPVKSVGLTERHSYSPQSQSRGVLWDGRVQWIIPEWASPEKLTPAGECKADWGICQSSSTYTSEANTNKNCLTLHWRKWLKAWRQRRSGGRCVCIFEHQNWNCELSSRSCSSCNR